MDALTTETIEILTSFGYVEHIDMIEPLRMGTATIIALSKDGVLLRHELGKTWMATVRTDEMACQFATFVNKEEGFCTHGDKGLEIYKSYLGYPRCSACYQVMLDRPIQLLDGSIEERFSFGLLDVSYLDTVAEHYHVTGPAYIQERLEAGAVLGAWELSSGSLAGFIGEHEEGALGMLEVFPQYRGQGLAMALERKACQQLQAIGRVPFAHIFDDNDASVALQKKLGFSFASQFTYWMGNEYPDD